MQTQRTVDGAATPESTTGDMAKALNADRGTIAAGVSHMVRATEIMKNDAVK